MSDEIKVVEISNGPFRAELLNLGGILRRLDVPDLKGDSADVTLGYRDLADYVAKPRFYGAIAGRYANRIGGAGFSIDGKEYKLAVNSGDRHNLHSGPQGFDRKIWKLERHDASSAMFSLLSPAGDMGFPGTLHVELVYALEADGLSVKLRATTDAATVVNLTHHAYFNLAGEASGKAVVDHWLQIPASHTTPVDSGLIPTGELLDVTGGPFDFRKPKPIGRDIAADDAQLKLGSGYDHNFVLDGPAGKIRRIATAYDPGSGRVMEVHSDQPGVQLYTGNHLANGAPGTSGVIYPARGGFCLEPQKFPDSPNKPGFPSARLNPGETYVHDMAFRFRTAESVEEAFPE